MAQLAQLSKLERQIGIKSSPDKFYGFFRNNMPRFPQMFQSNIKSFEIVGGGELKSGSVTRWKYCLGKMIFIFYIYYSCKFYHFYILQMLKTQSNIYTVWMCIIIMKTKKNKFFPYIKRAIINLSHMQANFVI